MNGIIKTIKGFYLDMWSTFWDNTKLVKIVIFICIYLASTIYNYKLIKKYLPPDKIGWTEVFVTFTPLINTLVSVGLIIMISDDIPRKIFGK